MTNTVVNVTRVTNVYNIYNSNQRNVTNITYVNQRVNNGVTLVSRDTFVNARPVDRNLGRFDRANSRTRRLSAGFLCNRFEPAFWDRALPPDSGRHKR